MCKGKHMGKQVSQFKVYVHSTEQIYTHNQTEVCKGVNIEVTETIEHRKKCQLDLNTQLNYMFTITCNRFVNQTEQRVNKRKLV